MAKQKKKKMPKTVWANGVNLRGLWSDKPIKMFCHDSEWGEEPLYYDKLGDIEISSSLGLDIDQSVITFASVNKKEVQHWTDGALAVVQMLQEVWMV